MEHRTRLREHPEFLLRSRVKQDFSASRPVKMVFHIVEVDPTIDEQGQERDDGACEANPKPCEAAALLLLPGNGVAAEGGEGRRRSVPGSPLIR